MRRSEPTYAALGAALGLAAALAFLWRLGSSSLLVAETSSWRVGDASLSGVLSVDYHKEVAPPTTCCCASRA